MLESLLFSFGSPQTVEFRNNGSYLCANEMCQVYTSMPSGTGGEIYTPNIMPSNSMAAPITDCIKLLTDNYNKLLLSFQNNVAEQNDIYRQFKLLANKLCQIPSKEVLVQYNGYDESLDVQMVLMDGVELSVSQFVNETSELVDFTISNNNRLLVCGEMPVYELLEKINDMTKG